MRRTRDFSSMVDGLQAAFPTQATSLVRERPRAPAMVSTLHSALLTDLTLGVVRMGVDVQARVGPMPGYQVVVALEGGIVGHFPSRVVDVGPATASINGAGEGAVLPHWKAGTTLLIIRIRPDAIAREVAKLAGHAVRGHPRFDSAFDLSSPRAQSWLRTVGLLVAELSEPGSLGRTSARHRQELERLVVGSLLRASENDYTSAVREDRTPPRWASVRRVVEAFERSPEHPWTLTDIADAAGVGVRRIEQAFREQLGISPTAYLQRLRLEGARRDLLDDALAVSDVAARWGFRHLGRFAGTYREHFGESPSETRHRSRSVLTHRLRTRDGPHPSDGDHPAEPVHDRG